jgi:polysaccharide biosynthesis transport protein
VSNNGSDVSGFRQYALMLRRGAPVVVLAMVLLAAAAGFLSMRQEPLYKATADVFIDTKNVGSSIADVNQSGVQSERVLETQALVARVPAVVRSALAKFPRRRDQVQFLARSSVETNRNADVLNFSVTDPDRRAAPALTNAYANAYTEYLRALGKEALRRARLEIEDQLTSLRERNRTSSSNYTNLTQRNQLLREREGLLDSIALPGRPARGAVQVQPHPVRNGILGGILGLLVGVGIVFVRDALNPRVRSPADIEESLGLPLLGRLYEPPRSLRKRHELAMIATPDAPETEAFQLLATNIEFANLDRGAKSFMIASANRGEGKSTTIANLAVTFARSGKRVVLVDLDLRRPVLHRFFRLEGRAGITNVTLGRAWLDDTLVRVPLAEHSVEDLGGGVNDELGGALEVLPAGELPSNVSEFLHSQALSDVLARLETRADLVLVDAPAMLAVSDAINVTQKVDALIVLTRVPTVRRPALEELRRLLDNAPVTKLGFVVTGADADQALMGSYGYGYAYQSDTRKTVSQS